MPTSQSCLPPLKNIEKPRASQSFWCATEGLRGFPPGKNIREETPYLFPLSEGTALGQCGQGIHPHPGVPQRDPSIAAFLSLNLQQALYFA